ncbi:MAG: LamG domain-containing protein [Cytophagales bacterium]|nr:LamG domain-containing protein [Cytophagales bacterium]
MALIGGVFNGPNNFQLYVDGRLAGTSDPAQINDFVTTDFRFSVGALDRARSSDADPNDPFDGIVDESKLFYRSLKPREILAEYQQALNQTPPAPPTNLQLSLTDSTQVALSWTDNSGGEAEFLVQRRRTIEPEFSDLAVVGRGNTTFQNGLLKGETEYFYRIKAVKGLVESDFTDSVAIVTGFSNEGPRVFWQFEETQGKTATDSSGNGFNGELFETAYRFDTNSDEGIEGNGLRFDGDDRVILRNAPAALDLGYPFSMSAWAKVSAKSSGGVVYIGDKSVNDVFYYLGISETGAATINVQGSGGSEQVLAGGEPINDGRWHLLSGVFRSDTVQELYVDGVLAGTLNPGLAYNTEIDRFTAGAVDRSSIRDRFNGLIDEVRLYNRKLTAEEILGEYNSKNQVPGVPSDLQVALENGFDAVLSWADTASSTTGFLIERKESPSTEFVALVELPKDSLAYRDLGLGSATVYTYRVRSITKTTQSVPSNEVSVETDQDLSRGLTVYWPFDEASGTVAADSSGNGLAGTLAGGLTFEANSAPGIIGNALTFDGVDDRVSKDDAATFGALDFPFTLSTWVKTTGTNDVFVFLGDKDDTDTYFAIRNNGEGNVRLQARFNRGSQNINGGNLNDGAWHHVAGVFRDANFHELFLDGASQGTLIPSDGFYSPGIDRFTAGRADDSTPANQFVGELDEVKLFDRALNTNEIQTLFRAPFVPSAPGNLEATLTANDKVSLDWEDNSGDELGFIIERKEPGGLFTPLDSASINAISYQDSTVLPSTNYLYRVVAFNSFGNSQYSNVDSIRTPGLVIPASIVAQYNFGVDSLNTSDTNPFSQASPFTDGPGLQDGTFFFRGFRGVNVSVLARELGGAVADQDYFEFTITPNTGFKTNLSRLSFNARRTLGGPRKVGVQTSVDGFDTTFVNTLSFAWQSFEINLSDPAYQVVNDPVTVRIIPYGKRPNRRRRAFRKNFLIDTVVLEAGFTTGESFMLENGPANARVPGDNIQPGIELLTEVISIFPNPVADRLTIHFKKALPGMHLLIHNSNGRQVYNTTIPGGTLSNTLDPPGLPEGLYLIKLYSPDQIFEFKLIKQP